MNRRITWLGGALLIGVAVAVTSATLWPQERITLTREKAAQMEAAVRDANFRKAKAIVSDILQRSEIRNWEWYPFNLFADGLNKRPSADYLKHLNSWVAENPDDPIPLLIRCRALYDIAWSIRGSASADEVAPEKMRLFEAYLRQAYADLSALLARTDGIPYAHYLKLNLLRSWGGDTPQLELAFQEAAKRYPGYYDLYEARLRSLSPIWGGSLEAMRAFVTKYANDSQHPNLRLLFMALYREYIDHARRTCRRHSGSELSTCIAAEMEKLVSPQLETEIHALLAAHEQWGLYEFSAAIGEILKPILRVKGAEPYAGAVLQLAANSLGSNTQLAGDFTRNNFVIDLLAAIAWDAAGHYENAEKKALHALADLKHFPFPGEEEKALAYTEVYIALANSSYGRGRYEDAIAHIEAARAIDRTLNGRDASLECKAYFRLGKYERALQVCAEILDKGGNHETQYWRGRSFVALNRMDEALKDYREAAARANDGWGALAVTNASVIFFERNQLDTRINWFSNIALRGVTPVSALCRA